MAKTIYRVEGASSGDSSSRSALSAPDLAGQQLAGLDSAPAVDAPNTTRRRLFWVLVVIAVLTVAMIAAIAVLGASESPAGGAAADPVTTSTIQHDAVSGLKVDA